MLQDLKHAARLLLQTKGWTAVVLLSLALGIGASTTIFTAVNGLLLRRLPVSSPQSMVRLRWGGKSDMAQDVTDHGVSEQNTSGEPVHDTFSFPMFQALRSGNRTLTDLLACASRNQVTVVTERNAELTNVFLVSGNYFQLLGVDAEHGRTILPADDLASETPVAVISHRYWMEAFGGDPAAIGKVIDIRGLAFTIVGVLPAEFTGIQNLTSMAPNITVPLSFDSRINDESEAGRLSEGTTWWLWIMGRLKPGVTSQQVRGNLDRVFQETARAGWNAAFLAMTPDQQMRSSNRNRTAVPHLEVDSGSRGIWDPFQSDVQSAALLGVVVLLLLVLVCANVANLLLSRAEVRQMEISIRLSMGATKLRLIRQLLTESILLASLGGCLGLLAGYWTRQLLPFAKSQPIDWHVLAFVTIVSLGTGIVFGLVPAMRASQFGLAGVMRENSRTLTRSRTLFGKSLLTAQVAISIVVLVAAGLFLRTLQNLRNVDIGFDAHNVILFGISPANAGYDGPRRAALYERIKDDVRSVPGVVSASMSQNYLLSGSIAKGTIYSPDGPVSGLTSGPMSMMTVSPEFFATMGIPLLRGRGFEPRDTLPGAPRVAVINETAALQYFAGSDAVGKRYGYSREKSDDTEIVGVLQDTKYNSLRDAVPPVAFRPMPLQSSSATFEVRTAVEPLTIQKPIREIIRGIDPAIPVDFATQAGQVENRYARERFFAMSYLLFGGMALFVASIGLFGLMSYSVVRRRNEIGVRMALGANGQDIVRMVVRESMLIVLAGVFLGVSISLIAGKYIASLLFGIHPSDPLTIAAAAFTMLAVSCLAGYLPAHSASRVDPMSALRQD